MRLEKEFCTLCLTEPHNGLGAPQAGPERSGATGPPTRVFQRVGVKAGPPTRVFQRVGVKAGPRERRRGGSAGAKPPGSSENAARSWMTPLSVPPRLIGAAGARRQQGTA